MTSNGCKTTAAVEWEVVCAPKKEGKEGYAYPEREGFREAHPDWCRSIVPLDGAGGMMERMEAAANAKLRADGHSELIREELVGGRLYTVMSR